MKIGKQKYSIIPGLAAEDPRLCAEALRLLCVLGTYTDDQGWCFPSQAELAKKARMHRTTVNRKLKLLTECAYVEKHQRKHSAGGMTSCMYRVRTELTDAEIAAAIMAMSQKGDTPVAENDSAKNQCVSEDPLSQKTTPPVAQLSDTPVAEPGYTPCSAKALQQELAQSNDSSEANASGADAPSDDDPKAVVFTIGLEALGGAQSARGLLGRLMRDHGAQAVADACLALVAERPIDPKAWLVRACQAHVAPIAKPRAGPEWLDEHAFGEPLNLADATPRQREWFERRAGPERCGFGKPPKLKRPRMYPRGKHAGWHEDPEW